VHYSLPYVFFAWSLAFFGVGIVSFAVQMFWEYKSGKAAIISMGGIGILLTIFSAYFARNTRFRGFVSARLRPADAPTPNGNTGESATQPAPEPTEEGHRLSFQVSPLSQWKQTWHPADSPKGAGDIEAQGGSRSNPVDTRTVTGLGTLGAV